METEQIFQDALLAKMAKTTELMSKLDTHKNGDGDDRASKCSDLYSYLEIKFGEIMETLS